VIRGDLFPSSRVLAMQAGDALLPTGNGAGSAACPVALHVPHVRPKSRPKKYYIGKTLKNLHVERRAQTCNRQPELQEPQRTATRVAMHAAQILGLDRSDLRLRLCGCER
jgi:hypothetical protein